MEFFHRVDLLLADEVGDGHHRPLTPVLPLHHHPIAEQLQRGVLGDAVALGYVGWGWGREVKQREGKSIDEEEEAVKTHGDGWIRKRRGGDRDGS